MSELFPGLPGRTRAALSKKRNAHLLPRRSLHEIRQDSGTFNTIWDSGSGNGSLTREFDPGTYKILFVSSETIADLLDINYASFLGVQLDWKFTEDKPADGAVPEPASWAMMLCGFGLVGGGIRASQRPRCRA